MPKNQNPKYSETQLLGVYQAPRLPQIQTLQNLSVLRI